MESCEKIGFVNLENNAKPEKKHVDLEQMYSKAEETIQNSKINIDDFVDIYEDMVERDKETAMSRKEKFASRLDDSGRECKKYADVMEAILVDSVNVSDWLGEDVKAMNTTDYDDFENGIDVIAEMTKEGGFKKHLGLAMDATFARRVSGKFNDIKGKIVSGRMSKVKYYQTDDYKGSLTNVPHVVIGVSLEKIKELGEMWVNGETDKLNNHPVQYQILEEMIMQLEVFEKYANKYDKPELAEVYKDRCETLKAIKAKKEEILPDTGERDHIFKNIKKEMDRFLDK
jgi:hypothetical protein